MYKQLNHVGTFVLIPEEAFLFKPYHSQHPTTPDDFKKYEGKVFRRLLFEGWAQQTYTPNELQQLKAFHNYLTQKGIQFDQRWDNPWKLRFLLSTQFKFDVTIKQMQKFTGYMEKVRNFAFTPIVSKCLHQGLFYIVGRDSHYRPIIVFDAQKIIKADLTENQLMQVQIYFFQYIMRNYFIPGQVQSWIAIIDSNYQGFFSLITTLQNTFTFLSQTYRMRLYCCYNLRINYAIKLVWGIVQKFLDQQTVNKIMLVQQQVPEALFTFTNRSQVQQKFGGTLPNLKQGHFWPPPFQVSKQYSVEGQNIQKMTREQYTKNFKQKILHDTKINEDLLIATQSTELRINHQKKKLKQIQRQIERQWQQGQQQTLDTSLAFKYLNAWPKPLNYSNLLSKLYQKNFA